ncbi:uncharacterized protein LOC132539945 [Erinaceus europaeus]|uniref:Uncharacterized protein LOC132539945 n=1 Tax=Erinaceus europaeus TaxID=9365 RepID=A0ABM3XV59_ERIEU|nr:uncharacterized protein LOC132539945 [Erinaceus europaeus]
MTSQSSHTCEEKGGVRALLSCQTPEAGREMSSLILLTPSRLLCWVFICLLTSGSTDDEVIQNPRHVIRSRGKEAVLNCQPKAGHDTVYWYRQALSHSLQFLVSYFEKEEREKGSIPDRFSAQQFGSVDPGVIQSPRHVIKGKGEKAILKCSPMSGHSSVSWYQQVLGQGPQFLVSYYEKMEQDKGAIPDRFSAQQLDNYSSEMNMTFLEPGDSALYLCASSLHSPAEPLAFCTQTSCPSTHCCTSLFRGRSIADTSAVLIVGRLGMTFNIQTGIDR